jgi:very-short-patch-repair endonuclease
MALDADRTRRFEAMGYRVLRFWKNDVLTNNEAVLGVILEAVASAAPHPDPLPEVEREQSCNDGVFE